MPLPLLAPLAISGISALAGLLGNRAQKQTQNSVRDSRTVQDINELEAPEYDAETLGLRNSLIDQYYNRMFDNDNFFSGYQTQGLSNINRGSDATQRAIDNILTSRGLTGTNAGLMSNIMGLQNSANQKSSLINSIPLLADQRQQQTLNDAGGFFSRIPIGRRRTGQNISNTHETGQGTSQTPSNMLGGMFTSLGTTLAGLYGQGAFGKTPTQSIPWASAPQGINYDIMQAPEYGLPGVKY